MLQTTVAASVLLVYAATPELPSSISQAARPCADYWSVAARDALPTIQASDELLAAICKLEANWDGHGGSPIHSETAKNAQIALKIFQQFGLVPEMIPNANGTISFEWISFRGEAHVEIGRTRFVGLIEPSGAAYIPLVGETGRYGIYDANIRGIAKTVGAILFPKLVPSLTTSKYAAANDRQAA